jgi:hypothetical protein
MMKKTHNLLVILAMLLAIGSCSQQTTPPPDNQTTPSKTPPQETVSPFPSPANTPELTPNTDLGSEISQPNNNGGGSTDFEEFFVWPVNRIGYVFERAVGWDELHEYIHNVWEPNRTELLKLPVVYSAIQYFNVSKEDFIKYNNEHIEIMLANGWATEGTFEDWMIDALYCGDEEEMVRLLLSPTTLYVDGEMFTMWDAASMSETERDALGLISDEWDEYVDRVKNELGDNAMYYEHLLNALESDDGAEYYRSVIEGDYDQGED